MNPYVVGWIAGVATALIPAVGVWFLLPWIRCLVSACPVALGQVIGMRLRGTPVMMICDAYIALRKGGVEVGRHTIDELETLYLAHRGTYTSAESLIAGWEYEIDARSR